MKAFSANTYFFVRDEAAFNRFMSDRVTFWTERLKNQENNILNPVEIALGEAIRDENLISASGVTGYSVNDFNRSMAEFRARTKAPEVFRAMFAEV